MKLFGAVLIVLCGGLFGAELFRRQCIARNLLGEACSLCMHMMSQIRYERAEPEMIIRTFYSENNTLTSLCIAQLNEGESFHQAWCTILSKDIVSALKADETALIRELGSGFGRSDTEGELARLSRINEELHGMHFRRVDDCRRAGKMYITSGFLTGVMIMLFMI